MEELEKFRANLNLLDKQIIELLGKRFDIIRAVGLYKKRQKIPMMQPKRVEEVKERCAQIGGGLNLDENFIKNLYAIIIQEACRVEDIIMEN